MRKKVCILSLLWWLSGWQSGIAQRTFAMRPAAFTGKGDATIIGNRVVVGSSNTKDNHGTTITNVDNDGDAATTINSTNATFSLPSGASVYWAGLYWGGRSSNSNRNTIKFKHASQSYQTLTATVLDDGNTISSAAGENHYQCYTDVTAYFQANGSGVYWAGDVYTMTGNGGSDPYGTGYYGGWSVIIIYSDPNEINRNITVFDGYNVCWNNTITVNISGFLTPETGTFTTKLGVIAWEGDLYITDDRLRMNTNSSANNIISSSSPGNNFFNGTITGTPRSPLTNQNWGVDFDYLVSNINPPNNSSSTNMYFSSSGDFYLPGALVFSIEINPILLPVQLISSQLTCTDGKPQWIWETASEINNLGFEIWRGFTPEEMIKTAFIKGEGTHSGSSFYKWVDINYQAGNELYYRLVQVDNNGISHHLTTQRVRCVRPLSSIQVFPIPAKDVLTVQLPESENGIVCKLYRMDGALIKEQKFSNNGMQFFFKIPSEILANQFYVLEILTAQGRQHLIVKTGN